MAFDTSYEKLVDIGVRVLDEVGWSLLRGNSNERHTLISRFEPNDLGTFERSTPGFVTTIAFTLAAFSLLLLLGSCRRWT